MTEDLNNGSTDIEILRITDGFDYIASAILESNGDLNEARELLKNSFDNLKDGLESSIFIKNNFFAIKRNENIEMQLIIIAGKLLSLSDTMNGAHMLFMNNIVLLDGIAVKALHDNGVLKNIKYKSDHDSEKALANFDSVFSKKEKASIKIVFGMNEEHSQDEDENKKYQDSLAVLSGSFSSDTWEFLSSIGRAVVSPKYFKRVEVEKRIGFVILTGSGVAMLEMILNNPDGFSKSILEDLGTFLK
jgi:hypothetical protein